MGSLLDTICSTVPKGKALLENNIALTQEIADRLGDRVNHFSSIVMDGYGSSRTAALISAAFIEKMTGLPVYIINPNNITRKIAADPNALYVFISESGGSGLLMKDLRIVKESKAAILVETANPKGALALEADCVVNTGCNDEEYIFHTVGQCCSTIALMLIGLRLGLERKRITKEAYNDYIAMAFRALNNHQNMVDATRAWCKENIHQLADARCIVLFGCGPVYGVAEEATIKIQEVTEKNVARAYETFQRIYGSTTCYGAEDVFLVLDDGVNETEVGRGIVEFMHQKHGNSFMVGPNPIRQKDLKVEIVGEEFRMLEFLAIVQVIAYELAIAENHPILDEAHCDAEFFDRFMKENFE